MTIESHKALVRRFVEEVYSQGNTDAIADYCVPGSFLAGGLAGQIMVMKTAFPDNSFTIDEMVAEADKVVVRMTVHGTNTGPLAGLPAFGRLERPVPPTGKQVTTTAIETFTMKDGRVVSIARALDQVGMIQQLGWTIKPPDPA
jgi:predicted ester cyclase